MGVPISQVPLYFRIRFNGLFVCTPTALVVGYGFRRSPPPTPQHHHPSMKCRMCSNVVKSMPGIIVRRHLNSIQYVLCDKTKLYQPDDIIICPDVILIRPDNILILHNFMLICPNHMIIRPHDILISPDNIFKSSRQLICADELAFTKGTIDSLHPLFCTEELELKVSPDYQCFPFIFFNYFSTTKN